MDETTRRAALSDLYALPGHLLWRAAARVSVELDRILPGAIDIHAYAALLALADEEPQSQRSLARLTGVSGTTLTSVAHTLQQAGLIKYSRGKIELLNIDALREIADVRARHRLMQAVEPVAKLGPDHHHAVDPVAHSPYSSSDAWTMRPYGYRNVNHAMQS